MWPQGGAQATELQGPLGQLCRRAGPLQAAQPGTLARRPPEDLEITAGVPRPPKGRLLSRPRPSPRAEGMGPAMCPQG